MKKLFLLTLLVSVSWLCQGCGGDKNDDSGSSAAFLRLNASQKLVANTKGAFNIVVTSNTDWKIEPKSTWLKPERTSGNGTMSVSVSFDENPQSKRSGVVRFSAAGLNPVDLVVTQSELIFTNPIAGIPDPWIVKQGDSYFLCKATGSGINVSKSNRLSSITGTQPVWSAPYDIGGNKVWNRANIWAPELHYVDGKWYIYYAAGRPTSETGGSYRTQRSGTLRAKSDDPTGEWEDMGMLYTGDNYSAGVVPTADNTNYAIDLCVFTLKGKLYAVWSGNPAGSGDQHLYIASMSNPYTISSSRVEISKPDLSWEKHTGKVNEGPAILVNEAKGKVFVVYSCNGSWTKYYRLGMLELDITKDPLVASNWKKAPEQVFYRCDDTANNDGVNGVGHCCFTKSPDGTEDWIVYHTKNRNSGEWGDRSTFLMKFTWNPDGSPNFGTPVGWGEPVALPSGETR